ncbi:chromosomal replication initiator DnaA [Hyphomonas sp.]|uniref:chromosomal replication initiator DnaA n=1 Tax=Hyphomonas sp. TaxID=87 RepID=UPI00391C1B1A
MSAAAGGSPPGQPAPPLLGFPPAAPDWDRLIRGAPNEAAFALAARPADWATPALCITGPARCGLSYLGEAWAARFGGTYLPAATFRALKREALDALSGMPVALDDADLAVVRRDDQLLSLLNMAASRGGRLLLLSHRSPAGWRTQSADLRSRLNALTIAEIAPPDEALLKARLQAAASARFMKLSRETINYLAVRLELSYQAGEETIGRLSEAVSRTGKSPGLALARQVLEGTEGPDEDEASEAGGG